MLPPGRARLLAQPASYRIALQVDRDHRNVACDIRHRADGRRARREDYIDLQAQQFVRKLGKPWDVSGVFAALDREILTLDIAILTHPGEELIGKRKAGYSEVTNSGRAGACCARATNGAVSAAPVKRVMISRRFIREKQTGRRRCGA
jgi:hypothetical protein